MKSKLFAATFATLLAGGLAVTAFADEHEGKAQATANAVGEAVDDATLVAKIKSSLLRSPEVEGLDVNVDAKDGVVTLSGTAATQTEKASAERIAKTSDGVKKVENKIVIKADAADRRPAVPAPAPGPAPGTPPPAN
jgi:osmotically-inducible protein OsmY